MKYMTFNSSCTYAALANMLEKKGTDVEDYEIALEMKLPFLIDRNEDGFVAGPMIQTKSWFDFYLNSKGFELIEDWVLKDDIFDYLKTKDEAMLGIKMQNGRNSHHSIVYTGMENGKAVFINNKHVGSDEPDKFIFSQEELASCLREKTRVGSLKACDRKKTNIKPFLEKSIDNLTCLRDEFISFCDIPRTNKEILNKEFGLFRPILLDGPSMMKLLGQESIYDDMRDLQKVFVRTAFNEKADNVLLKECFDMKKFQDVCDGWSALIRQEITKC